MKLWMDGNGRKRDDKENLGEGQSEGEVRVCCFGSGGCCGAWGGEWEDFVNCNVDKRGGGATATGGRRREGSNQIR